MNDELLPRRIERIRQVAAQRLAGLTVVLEHVHDPHNVSAVLRSAEGFGLSAVHVIWPEGRLELNKAVTQGCHKWLDVRRYRDSLSCLEPLRAAGFRLCGADPKEGAKDLRDLDFSKPTALIFGSEHHGLSPQARELCDDAFAIRMRGFSQSFNISVAAAICLFWGAERRREALGRASDLTEAEIEALQRTWIERELASKRRET